MQRGKDKEFKGKTAKINCSIVLVIELYACGKKTTVTFEAVRLTTYTGYTVTFRMSWLSKPDIRRVHKVTCRRPCSCECIT